MNTKLLLSLLISTQSALAVSALNTPASNSNQSVSTTPINFQVSDIESSEKNTTYAQRIIRNSPRYTQQARDYEQKNQDSEQKVKNYDSRSSSSDVSERQENDVERKRDYDR